MDPDLEARLSSLDARVRARAGVELARRVGADPGLEPILRERLEQERDEDALRAIVSELPDDASLALRAACGARLERAGPALRATILDRVLAWTQGFPESLRARVPHETDAELRGKLIDAWIARAGARDAVAALGAAPYPVLADALARARPGSLGWQELAPVVARAIPVLEPLILPHLSDAEDPVRQRLLANVVARALEPAVIGAPLRQDLAARALGLLDALFDRAGLADALEADVHRRLLGAAERILGRADPDHLDAAEHELVGRVARIRRRLGARDPRGWLGAVLPARRERGLTSVIEHALPDGTSTVTFAVAGLELRARSRDVRELASTLVPPTAPHPLLALDYGRRELWLDAAPLHASLSAALAGALTAHARLVALADDLARVADTAVVRGAPLRAELVEGWIEDDDPETRTTLVGREPERG